MSAFGTKRTWRFALHMSAFDPKRTSRATFLQSDAIWVSVSVSWGTRTAAMRSRHGSCRKQIGSDNPHGEEEYS